MLTALIETVINTMHRGYVCEIDIVIASIVNIFIGSSIGKISQTSHLQKMAVAPAVICKKENKFASTSDQDLEIFW